MKICPFHEVKKGTGTKEQKIKKEKEPRNKNHFYKAISFSWEHMLRSIHEQHKSLGSPKTSFNEHKHQLKSNTTWFKLTAITLNATNTSDNPTKNDTNENFPP